MICSRYGHSERQCNSLRYIPTKLNMILKLNRNLNNQGDNKNMPDMSDILNMAQSLSGLQEDTENNSDLSGVMNMLKDLKNVRKNTGKKKKMTRKMRRKLEKKLRKKNKRK